MAHDWINVPGWTHGSQVQLSLAISPQKLIVLIMFAFGAAVPPPCFAANENQCGVVIGLTGAWKAGDRQLTLGDRISAGTPPSPTADGRLTVWFEGQKPVYVCREKSCNIANPSNWPPACQNQKDDSPGILTTLSRWFAADPSRYFTAASRGLEGDLKEAVIPLTTPQVDIAAAVAELTAGVYWVSIESLGGDGFKTAPAQIQWPAKPPMVSASGLKLGVNKLVLLDESREPVGSEAWILLCTPREYSTTSATFQEVVHTVATWPSGTDPAAIRAVSRASLEVLAKEGSRPKP